MLGLAAAASATGAAIHKKETGNHKTLLISNNDLNNLLKVIICLENNGILLDGITEAVKDEVKEQRGGFLSTLLSVVGSALLFNMLSGKGVIRAGEGTVRARYGSKTF